MSARVWVLSLAALSLSAGAQTLQKLALYQGADRQQRLAEGAKKEGALIYYTTFPNEYAERLTAPFEKRYGVKVSVWRARSELVLQKAIAEARGGSPGADVITIISPQAEVLRREQLLQE